MLTQHHWINTIKTGCNVCHQLGNLATREFPPGLGTFESSYDAWDHRTQVGQDGTAMISAINGLGRRPALTMYADWTDRIAAGEVPPVPPRPQGIERNLVLTLWEWGGPATFAHDELSTDKRNPRANANGPIYGVDWGNDGFLTLDPNTHTATEVRIPVVDPTTPPGKPQVMPRPSPYWGSEPYWYDPAITNHAAMDSKGRVWMSSRFRRPENQPDFCRNHPSAALAPQESSFRQVQYYDPQTKSFHPVNICFDTHHVQFASDADETLYGNGVFSGAIGWINTRILDETGDEAAAQGWCLPYYDIDGNGKIEAGVDRYVFEHLGRPSGQLAGMRIPAGVIYSVIAHPTDGTVWGAVPGPMPGRIIRIDPKTCVSEVYEPPFNNPEVNVNGYTPRGIDVDTYGVIWTALAGSGHLASFDRRKCRVLSGPAATTAQHCPEGWTLYRTPGPSFKGATDAIPVDMHYYNFVDKFNTLGLGPERAARERHELRLAARVAARRPLGRATRAVSARILLARHGRPHRRSERRLEGPGALCRLRPERGLAHRGRQRNAQLADQVSTASRSACQVIVWSSARRACCEWPPLCSASPQSVARTANATSRAIGVNDSTRICPNEERAPRSAITRACRSMTPHACAPTRGMRRSGRCRSGNASRTRPTTGRAVRRRCASAARSTRSRRT